MRQLQKVKGNRGKRKMAAVLTAARLKKMNG
jgi:hypothetical protein